MRKIDLTDYQTGVNNENGDPITFNVRRSLIEVLFLPAANGRELLERDKTARLIDDWPDASLLLSEDQWTKLKAGLDEMKVNSRLYVEFARRIMEAPDVPVVEKQ